MDYSNSFIEQQLDMPNHRRGPWSQAEDTYLMSLVAQSGPNNWVRISQAIGTRSAKQCRERYHQNLKPTLNHTPITPEEGEQIEKMVNEMGKRWAEIARRLCGRSDNAVKNWWNGGVNRRRRLNSRRSVEKQPDPRPYPHAHLQHSPPHHAQPYYPHPPPPQHEPHYFSRPMEHPRPISVPSDVATPSHYGPPQYRSHHHPPRGLDLSQTTAASYHHPGRSRAAAAAFDTPLPSPSAASVMSSSESAPSLVSDTSESRSPYAANSPIELPPLIGTRGERRRSSVAYLQPGTTGFATDEDVVVVANVTGTGALQLPSLTGLKSKGDDQPRRSPSGRYVEVPQARAGAPLFREPDYGAASSAATPTATSFPSFAPSHPPAATLAPPQLPLPSFHTLSPPGLNTGREPDRIPSPRTPTALDHGPRSPASATSASASKDARMTLSAITG